MAENVIVRLEVAKLNRTIHPFYVKSKWIPAPVQQSVALESYLEEVKLQLAEIKITKPKQWKQEEARGDRPHKQSRP